MSARSFDTQVPGRVLDFVRETPLPLMIGGQEVAASSGATIQIRYPATGELVAEVSEGGETDARAAIAAARHAHDIGPWPKMSPAERSRKLDRLAQLMERDAELLATLESLETGKPISESIGDVSRAIDGMQYYAASARMCRGETIPLNERVIVATVRQPLGVVVGIVPWNVPLVLAVAKAAPALAVGNAVIIKPSELTPLTTLAFGRLAHEAELPEGVLNVVTGAGPTVGQALVDSPLVDGVTYTGGTDVGCSIAAAAVTRHKRVQVELGGKSPNIIFSDADLPRAIEGAAKAIFYGQGQICSAGSRLLVEREVFDLVLEGLVERTRNLRIGDPLLHSTEMGSLISRAHRARVCAHVARAVQDGASIAAGGEELHLPGFESGAFMAPTVLVNIRTGTAAEQEEIFGPVLIVMPFASEAEAVALANGTRFGLGSGVWTASSPRSHRIARALRAGVVWINGFNLFDTSVPFGGVKASGGGSREWSQLALESFVEVKTIWECI